jgi:hypothetical protein
LLALITADDVLVESFAARLPRSRLDFERVTADRALV